MRCEVAPAQSNVEMPAWPVALQSQAAAHALQASDASTSSSSSSTPAEPPAAPAPAAPVAKPVAAPAKAPPKPTTDHLPPFKVLLHNDDENDQLYVVRALVDVAHVPIHQAFELMMEAHNKGLSLVKVTHREHAELLMEQLRSKGLIATIEAQ